MDATPDHDHVEEPVDDVANLVNAALAADRAYADSGDPADVRRAAALARAAYELLGDAYAAHPAAAEALADVTAVLVTAEAVLFDGALLDDAVTAGRRAVTVAASAEVAGMAAGNLAAALRVRYERRGDPADLDAARQAAEESVRVAVPDEPWLPGRLGEYAHILGLRYEATGDRRLVRQAVDLLRRAVELAPDEPTLVVALAGMLQSAHTAGEPGALDEAVGLLRRERPETGPAARAAIAQVAAVVWTEWAARHRDPDSVREARRQAIVAIESATDTDTLATSWDTLASVLRCEHELTGETDVLDDALTASEQALALTREGDFDHLLYLGNLGVGRQLRYLATGERSDLDAAVEAHRAVVDALPTGYADRGVHLHNLGVTLRLRHAVTGDTGDGEAAVRAATDAVATTPLGHADRPARISNLGSAVHTRFAWTGAVGDLDLAVDHHRAAVDCATADHPLMPGLLTNLGFALDTRYGVLGSRADLDEAIDAHRAALAAAPRPGDRPALLANLASSLHDRHELTGDREALHESVALTSTAVDLLPPGHPSLPGLLANLVVACVETGQGLTGAVRRTRDTLALLPAGHPDRLTILANLSFAEHRRYQLHGDPAALAAAVEAGEEAVRCSSPSHPDHAVRLLNHAAAVHARFRTTGVRTDLTAAVDALRSAATATAAPLPVRIRAARSWGELAAEHLTPAEAADAFAYATNLLPMLSAPRLEGSDVHRWLGMYQGLASDAAALAIEAGRRDQAVELLELGRGVLLNRELRLLGDQDRLRRVDPRLADEVERLRVLLNQGVVTPVPPAGQPGDIHHRTATARLRERRRVVDEELRAAVARARQLPGLAGFHRPPSLSELQDAARHGPLVVVNVSDYRSDALILTVDGVTVVPLPEARPDTLDGAVRELHAAAEPASDTVAAVLDTVRTTITEPVLRHLAATTGPPGRMWWVPTGPAALLPLHVTRPATGIVMSYTPTIGALRHARRHRIRDRQREVVVAAVATSAAGVPLPAARAEAEHVAALLGGEPMVDDAVTRPALVAALRTGTWVHLALHTRAEADDPARGHVVLSGTDRLTVAELPALRSAPGELAYLSSCETMLTSRALADEAVHLTAAFQLAGFSQVIGALWVVKDRVAARLTREVYARLSASGEIRADDAARALHESVAVLRRRYPTRPEAWAAYVHVGA